MNPYSKWIGLMVLSGLMVASVRADLPTDPEEYREWGGADAEFDRG